MTYAELVAQALAKARAKHAPMNSRHEAYAVILEELDEFWAEVKRQDGHPLEMLQELVHVSAMCQRAAEDLGLLGDD